MIKGRATCTPQNLSSSILCFGSWKDVLHQQTGLHQCRCCALCAQGLPGARRQHGAAGPAGERRLGPPVGGAGGAPLAARARAVVHRAAAPDRHHPRARRHQRPVKGAPPWARASRGRSTVAGVFISLVALDIHASGCAMPPTTSEGRAYRRLCASPVVCRTAAPDLPSHACGTPPTAR